MPEATKDTMPRTSVGEWKPVTSHEWADFVSDYNAFQTEDKSNGCDRMFSCTRTQGQRIAFVHYNADGTKQYYVNPVAAERYGAMDRIDWNLKRKLFAAMQ